MSEAELREKVGEGRVMEIIYKSVGNLGLPIPWSKSTDFVGPLAHRGPEMSKITLGLSDTEETIQCKVLWRDLDNSKNNELKEFFPLCMAIATIDLWKNDNHLCEFKTNLVAE